MDERRLEERCRLLSHCDYFFRPSASFYAELEGAIELAAAGRTTETMSFGGEMMPVAGLIDEFRLEEFVERAKNLEHEPDEDEAFRRSKAPLRGFEPRFPD